MRRQRLGLAILLVLTVHGAPAQQLETLPYYEEQMAGVRLGWHARTITGLWNYDQVRSDIQARLRSLYRMPDHIIMRVGTRIPIFTGSGAGPDGSYNFYLGTYGRGNTEGGGGLGGGAEGGAPGAEAGVPAQAQGPTDAQINERVRRFIAQAQAAEAVPAPAAPAGPEGAPSAAGPPAGVAGPGLEGLQTQRQPTRTVPPDQAERELTRLQTRFETIVTRLLALDDQARTLRSSGRWTTSRAQAMEGEAQRLLREAYGLIEQAMQLATVSGTIQNNPAALAFFGNVRLFYHVFHVGRPERDIVFCYRMDTDTWISITVNFFTWQVNGVTVANTRDTWGGARTSPGEDGTPGIALGDNLQRVFNRYGWPDGWESFYGRYMLVHYYDTNNVGFLLDHPSPKVWRVVRIIIEPRPNAQERQLGGVQLGMNAQNLLTIRSRTSGRLVYGEPVAIERPNHRISMISQPPQIQNWPPGVLLDPAIFGVDILSTGGGGGAGGGGAPGAEGGAGAEGVPGAPGAPSIPRMGTGGGYDVGAPAIATPAAAVVAGVPGTRPTSATDRYGRPVAQAQAPAPDAGLPGQADAGLGQAGAAQTAGTSGNVLSPYPMPFYYARDAMNVEAVCADGGGGGGGGAAPTTGAPEQAAAVDAGAGGAPGGGPGGGGGGGGAASVSRDQLAQVLNRLYGDETGQVGFNIAYGMRSSPACHIDTAVPETQFRWDYRFVQPPRRDGSQLTYLPPTNVEFGVDADGMCTQVGVLGIQWGGARTMRGIGLGSSLRDILLRYGPPLLYSEFVQDVAEQQPNVTFASYSRDEIGRPQGNLNMVMQDKKVTAMQIFQLRVR